MADRLSFESHENMPHARRVHRRVIDVENLRLEKEKTLLKMRSFLSRPVGEHGQGPVLVAENNEECQRLVFDVLGQDPTPLVRVWDIKRYVGNELRYASQDSVFRTVQRGDRPPFLEMNLCYSMPNSAKVDAEIVCYFFRENGVLKLNFEQWRIPSTLQQKGVALEMLKEAAGVCDAFKIRELCLLANIEVGAYAWAKYGVGWDMGTEEKRRQNREAVTNWFNHVEFIIDCLPDAPRRSIFLTRQEISRLKEAVDALTPQDLATFDPDPDFKVRQTRQGYRLDSSGMPLGKAAMLSKNEKGRAIIKWYGRIELRDERGEKTLARKLVEEYFAFKTEQSYAQVA